MITSFHKSDIEPLTRTKKWCNDCKQEKDLSHFHREKYRKDGRAIYCRDCKNTRSKLYHVLRAKPKTDEQVRKYKLDVAKKRLEFWVNKIKELEG